MKFTGKQPENIGVTNGKLSPCPSSSNCVSSQSDNNSHYISPLSCSDNAREDMVRLKKIIASLNRTKIITANEDYIHAECRSRWMGFIDDLEIYRDQARGMFHVRSASRVGYSDLGVNRRRVEKLRRLFNTNHS